MLLALSYAALIAYGTLYPFRGWSEPPGGVIEGLLSSPLAGSQTDILVNFLVYLPFGLLLFKGLPPRLSSTSRLLVVIVTGASLSFVLEYLQAYLPNRVPSLLDLLLNTVGSLTGGLLARFLGTDARIGARLVALRQRFFKPGPEGNLGLFVLCFWALSQLTPLVPSLDLGHLWEGIKPLWLTLSAQQPFIWTKAVVYGCEVAALGLLLERTLFRQHGTNRFLVIATGISAVLLLKVPIVGRSLSLETLAGLGAGLLVLPLLAWSHRRHRTYAAIFFLFTAQAIRTLEAPVAPTFHSHAFNWVPFHGHLTNELAGFASILETIWPFLAISLAVQLSYRRAPRGAAPFVGGALVFGFVLALEWLQQSIPGRYPDVTTPILAVLAWSAPWVLRSIDATRALQSGGAPGRTRTTHPLVATATLAGLTFALGLLALASGPAFVTETRVDQSKEPTHPAPELLPPVDLPGFRYSHPRLPAPTPSDLARLRRDHPRYLSETKRAARDGAGNMGAAVIAAYLEPGSINLDKLHRRLMTLRFQWRGHEQTKPLALAYDWLYEQWSDQQRAELQSKLVAGGQYLIDRIRKERLSPYNVYLYNSPLQALVALSLAVYGDTPEAEPIMRFTANFWKERTLPVWRQIMGQNGGWHEGGEYVGIGIGQAVYQIPAMWRSATGEDFFAEPSIRGFLDFLVYRTRPDGTHFRWGDGAFHDRLVPDRVPLAIELRHAAAYSLGGCPKRIEPTSWPWGPFPDSSLCDPSAVERLPLTKYFDGIGLLVARSGWGEEATYLTFKAGDNFWSHSHLDQGAFTLYKGGALAIDSGAYGGGSGYGSDHHMNYSYQTVAHNLVTVMDPADTVPKPEREGRPPRPIANDGGQRRVGSGWGVEAAPLDLSEWQRKREIYHTGTMRRLHLESDLAVAVADLTPAYTNSLSGKGTFSHRTHRVAAYVRTLGFDLEDEVVVIHDRVKSTSPQLAKRWLLHSVEEPHVEGVHFSVQISPATKPERPGGSALGAVLLPKNADLRSLGGPGFEFFVDGVNYDDGGGVWERAGKVPTLEPGAWRLVLSPTSDAETDVFLVVLIPGIGARHPGHQIRGLEDGDRYGCEIVGPKRTTRWWFDPDHDGPVIEVTTPTKSWIEDLRVTRQSDRAGGRGDLRQLLRRLTKPTDAARNG